ncbi:MAG: alanyl-tRNA editing protein, partial [Lachnospiraceae bacterium]|nr:alanyl-tRNA editing protein [Lachnospiraceae bacterium]
GGVRVEMMCGRWAYLYMTQIYRQNHEISTLLSSRMPETAAAVKRLLDDEAQLKTRMIGMQYQMIERRAEELKGCGPVLIFEDDLTPVLVQKLTARVMEKAEGPVFSFSGNDEEGYKYAVGMEGGDLKELVRDMNAQLSGRGGGKPFFLQGSVKASGERIETYLSDRLPGLKVVRQPA